MDIDSKTYRIAASRVSINLSLGILPLISIALIFPGVHPGQTVSLWICLTALFAVSQVLLINTGSQALAPPFGFLRITSCLLLGTSLMAVFWRLLDFPHAFEIMVASFSIRWMLYFIETRDLHLADQRRQPLPSLSTRIRRSITFVTGAAIPALIFLGLPAVPLLSLSFILTALSQWAINCEMFRDQPEPAQVIHATVQNEHQSSIG